MYTNTNEAISTSSAPTIPAPPPDDVVAARIARRREVASMGGKAAAALGVGHKWNSDTARAAALKGHAARKARAVQP